MTTPADGRIHVWREGNAAISYKRGLEITEKTSRILVSGATTGHEAGGGYDA